MLIMWFVISAEPRRQISLRLASKDPSVSSGPAENSCPFSDLGLPGGDGIATKNATSTGLCLPSLRSIKVDKVELVDIRIKEAGCGGGELLPSKVCEDSKSTFLPVFSRIMVDSGCMKRVGVSQTGSVADRTNSPSSHSTNVSKGADRLQD